MKKLFLFLFSALLTITTITVHANALLSGGTDDLYKYLSSNINYPEKAKLKDLQGNSIILFSLTEGKISNTSIYTELGSGCDVAVLNQILAYPHFREIKNGRYAIKTSFRLNGSTSPIENENAKMPEGYIELNVTINSIAITHTNSVNLIRADSTNNSFKVNWSRNDSISKNPKLIVDGKEIAYNDINTVDPDNIYSINVLKGETAVLKYGTSAVNGVIIVVTKSNVTPVSKKESQPVKKEN